MKKIIIAVLLTGLIFGASYYEHNYTRENCKVTQANDGWATITDNCGMAWDYENRNLRVGDIVDLKMHDSNTSSYIKDDVIRKVVLKGNALQ